MFQQNQIDRKNVFFNSNDNTTSEIRTIFFFYPERKERKWVGFGEYKTIQVQWMGSYECSN